VVSGVSVLNRRVQPNPHFGGVGERPPSQDLGCGVLKGGVMRARGAGWGWGVGAGAGGGGGEEVFGSVESVLWRDTGDRVRSSCHWNEPTFTPQPTTLRFKPCNRNSHP